MKMFEKKPKQNENILKNDEENKKDTIKRKSSLIDRIKIFQNQPEKSTNEKKEDIKIIPKGTFGNKKNIFEGGNKTNENNNNDNNQKKKRY